MEDTRSKAAEQGYVKTLFGRRLYLPEINSSNGMRRQAAERTAINAPMQGTAADIIKLAMLKVSHWLQDNADIKMIMQVHDELVFEIPEKNAVADVENIIKIMKNCVSLNLPLEVNYGIDKNWGDAH